MKVGDLVKLTWFTQSYLGLVMSESSFSTEHFNIFIMENGEDVMRLPGEVKVIAYAGR
jgi:hypothetical protein